MASPIRPTIRETRVLDVYNEKGARCISTLYEQSGESKTVIRAVAKKFKLTDIVNY